ncbi:MAG TPA: hypothetical protein ENI23_12535, partial [bacterium]|nr:hypothetical protein [bacterium]
MLQISPSKAFPITYVISDPSDSSTYFVQAIVRNASTNTTLETVDLTDQGGGIHSKDYTTPSDPSQTGTGLYIIITVTVFTDSAHTTKSGNYAIVTDQYLVKTIVDPHTIGGGGADLVSMKRMLNETIEETLGKRPPEDMRVGMREVLGEAR